MRGNGQQVTDLPGYGRVGQYLTEADVSRITKIARGTLRNWRSAGIGPPFRKLPGGAIRYAEAEVIAWMDSSKVETIESVEVA